MPVSAPSRLPSGRGRRRKREAEETRPARASRELAVALALPSGNGRSYYRIRWKSGVRHQVDCSFFDGVKLNACQLHDFQLSWVGKAVRARTGKASGRNLQPSPRGSVQFAHRVQEDLYQHRKPMLKRLGVRRQVALKRGHVARGQSADTSARFKRGALAGRCTKPAAAFTARGLPSALGVRRGSRRYCFEEERLTFSRSIPALPIWLLP